MQYLADKIMNSLCVKKKKEWCNQIFIHNAKIEGLRGRQRMEGDFYFTGKAMLELVVRLIGIIHN